MNQLENPAHVELMIEVEMRGRLIKHQHARHLG